MQEAVGIAAVDTEQGRPDAGADAKVGSGAGQLVRFGQAGDDALHQRSHRGAVHRPLLQHREAVAGDAGKQVACTQHPLQALRGPAQQAVTDAVAVVLIDLAEVVQVDADDSQPAAAARPAEQLWSGLSLTGQGQAAAELAVVQRARQGVVLGQRIDALLSALVLARTVPQQTCGCQHAQQHRAASHSCRALEKRFCRARPISLVDHNLDHPGHLRTQHGGHPRAAVDGRQCHTVTTQQLGLGVPVAYDPAGLLDSSGLGIVGARWRAHRFGQQHQLPIGVEHAVTDHAGDVAQRQQVVLRLGARSFTQEHQVQVGHHVSHVLAPAHRHALCVGSQVSTRQMLDDHGHRHQCRGRRQHPCHGHQRRPSPRRCGTLVQQATEPAQHDA